MQPEVKGDELIEKFKKNRMDILTKQDSIPCILSDFPTQKTATKCAIIAVEEIIDNHSHRKGHTIEEFNYWNEVLTYLKSKP